MSTELHNQWSVSIYNTPDNGWWAVIDYWENGKCQTTYVPNAGTYLPTEPEILTLVASQLLEFRK